MNFQLPVFIAAGTGRRLLGLAAGLWSLTATAAWAQPQESIESQTKKQQLREQYLQSDTAQAIINLYSKRQAGGAGWIVGSMLAVVRIATATPAPTGSAYVTRDNSSNGGAAFLFALPFAGYGAAKIAHYSNGHLEQILTSYAAGVPLPISLRRKLKPRFFDQTIIEYTPVNARAINVQPAK